MMSQAPHTPNCFLLTEKVDRENQTSPEVFELQCFVAWAGVRDREV